MNEPKLIDIACEVKIETDSAWLINDGTKEAWLPKSQVEMHVEDKGTTAVMPEWLAQEKGLI